MTRYLRALACLAGAAVMLHGCLGDESSVDTAAVDSWTVDDAPVRRLEAAGEPAFDFLRIQGVMRLPDGEIVVADGASQELRLFSPRGDYVRALSREGRGPGELRSLTWAGRSADTVFAFGFFGGYLNAYTRAGFLPEPSVQLGGFETASAASGGAPPPPSGPVVSGRLSSGELLIVPGGLMMLPDMEVGELFRDSLRLGIQASHRDSVVRWLGSFPGTTFYTYASPRLRDGVMMARFTHGPQLAYAVSSDRIWIGDSGHDTISVYDRSASLVASVVWPEAARPLSAEALQRVRDRELAEADDDDRRNGIEALHGTALRTATAPFFTTFVPGADGEMWVERYREDPLDPAEFLVFGRDGALLAEVTLPPRLTPHEIGSDYVLGVERDELGVETPVEYRLRRRD